MKKIFHLVLLGLCWVSISSCYDDLDDKITEASLLDKQNFVFEGLKRFYLYKEEIPELTDNHFPTEGDKIQFLEQFDSPEALFDQLLYTKDRFSIIVPDFIALEKQLNGIAMHNGMAYGLVKLNATNEVFGYVRYVLENTSASQNQVERGMIFNRINGQELTETNYRELLAASVYTIGLAKLTENGLENLDTEIELHKTELQEDPIFMHKTLTINGQSIGYLMYNQFTASFDEQLNQAFADFKADHIGDLVLDLRYNPGGSIRTAQILGSLITGQFAGQLFATEVFNANFPEEELEFLSKTAEGTPLNSLELNRVYIITSQSTASASELTINSLKPYIDVIQVGETTVGKFQGSVTLYDSPDFTRASVQPGHTYAMQPLILKTINKNGETDYYDGLAPSIQASENFQDLGELGNPSEQLLGKALENITGKSTGKPQTDVNIFSFQQIGESGADQILYQQMYEDFKK